MSEKWRELLVSTNWGELTHAFGVAADTPWQLACLIDPALRASARERLADCLLHKGAVYDAAHPAMEVVAHMVVARALLEPEDGYHLLRRYAAALTHYGETNPSKDSASRHYAAVERVLAPLLDGPEAAKVVPFFGVTGWLSPEAVTPLFTLAVRRPTDDLAVAAFVALARADQEPEFHLDDWRLRMLGAWFRLIRRAERPGDIETIAKMWPMREELSGMVDLAGDLLAVNPAGAREVYMLLPESPQAAEQLMTVVQHSPAEAPLAQAAILRMLYGDAIEPYAAIDLLRRLVPTPEVYDLVDWCGHRPAEPKRQRDIRADAGAMLAAAGDPRWEEHVLAVLTHNPRPVEVRPTGSAWPLTHALQEAPVAGTPEMLEQVRRILREELGSGLTWEVESMLRWLGDWGNDDALAARPEVLAWAEDLPGAVAQVLAAWGDPGDVELVRRLAVDDADARLALARRTGELRDWHTVIGAPTPYLDDQVLREYPDATDPVFIEWATKRIEPFVLGDDAVVLDQRVAAIDRLVEEGVRAPDESWDLLLESAQRGGPSCAAAIALAASWVRDGRVSSSRRDELLDLLGALATSRLDLGGDVTIEGRLVAAREWLRLEGQWPCEGDRLRELVWVALSNEDSHGALGGLLSAVAERGGVEAREAALASVKEALDGDRRLKFVPERLAEEEAERAALIDVAARLEAGHPGPR